MKYDQDRPEMLAFVPLSAQRILDVGCAGGRFGAALRKHRPDIELWGIDTTHRDTAFLQSYDKFIHGAFPQDVSAERRFDCLVFNDVLEHLQDPWGALADAKPFLEVSGTVVASLPNVRHVSVLAPLVLFGRWEYRETGILDHTHLRFFTRSTIRELFGGAGYRVERLEGIRLRPTRGRLATLSRLLRGRLDDFLAERFAVLASLAEY